MTLGEQVLQARLSLKLSQKKFAVFFLTHPVTICRWETGATTDMLPIHRHTLARIRAKLIQEGRLLPLEALNAR